MKFPKNPYLRSFVQLVYIWGYIAFMLAVGVVIALLFVGLLQLFNLLAELNRTTSIAVKLALVSVAVYGLLLWNNLKKAKAKKKKALDKKWKGGK